MWSLAINEVSKTSISEPKFFLVVDLVRPLPLCRGPDAGEFTITAVTADTVLVLPRTGR